MQRYNPGGGVQQKEDEYRKHNSDSRVIYLLNHWDADAQ